MGQRQAGGRRRGERLAAMPRCGPGNRIVSAVVQLGFPRDCEMPIAKAQIQIT